MAYKNSTSTTLATQLASMGIHGHEVVVDGSFSDKRFVGFRVRTNATVTFKDYAKTNGQEFYGQKTNEAYVAGYEVVGDIRDLTVSAGKIDAYYQAGERTAND